MRELGNQIIEVCLHFSPAASAARMSGAHEEQIYLVGPGGRQIFAQSWSSYPLGRNVMQFKASLNQVTTLAYRRRPYETREIRNVSLVPGQKTIVATSDAVPR
jgi:hypothetical protein